MSIFAYPSETIRDAERPHLDAGVPLMARAARGLADFCLDQLSATRGQVAGSRVCVLAGPGNNAGDGLFAAAALAKRGARITVVTLFDRTHSEGLAAARSAGADVIEYPGAGDHRANATGSAATGSAHTDNPRTDNPRTDNPRTEALHELDRADLVLDAIIGTGGRRGLPGHVNDLVRDWTRNRQQDGLLIAVDIPSGLDPEAAGSAESAHPAQIRAEHTVTFGGLKTELVDPRVAAITGTVHVIDIGLGLDPNSATAQILNAEDLRTDYPRPDEDGYKYSRGVAGVLAGSEEYPGAGVLTATSATNSGVGMVRYLGAQLVAEFIIGLHAEVVNASGRVDSIVMGPGDPESEYVQAAVDALTDTAIPVVLDAGALDMVGRAEAMAGTWLARRPVVLTPHAGELARLLSRLLGEIITAPRIGADPLGWAREAAKLTGMIVLLKGHRTVIATPDGFCVLPQSGPASLATAGSGDVLAGILGGLSAIAGAKGRSDSEEAHMSARQWAHLVGLGVLLHNAAGHRAVNAGGLVDAVAEVVAELMHPRTGHDGTGHP